MAEAFDGREGRLRGVLSGMERAQPGARPREARARVLPRPAGGGGEADLVALARSPASLRRALARVAGRMLASRGWERLGFARVSDYAAERAGVSPRELRDLACVDAALAGLPRCEAAYLGGRINWTQLRLLCRVAEREDEDRWLALASRLTARALAREVRGVEQGLSDDGDVLRATDEDDDKEDRRLVIVRGARSTRARWWRARELANRVAGHALSWGEFAEALVGEVLSAAALEVEAERPAHGDAVESEGDGDDTAEAEARARAAADESAAPPGPPPAFVVALQQDLDSADAFELDARLRRALELEARQLARVASELARVVALGVYRDLGYRSLDRYAEERLGMAPSRARALLRIERAAVVCPELREAFASGRVSWVQAHALVPLLLDREAEGQRSAWIRHAARVSVRRLVGDVGCALASGRFAPPPLDPAKAGEGGLQTGAAATANAEEDGSGGRGRQPGAEAFSGAGDSQVLSGIEGEAVPVAERVRIHFTTTRELARLFQATLVAVQRRIERIRRRPSSEGEALEAMLDHAMQTWEALGTAGAVGTRWIREHRVFERDGWRCAAPGCSSYRNLHSHHIVFRGSGGSEDPSNLTTMCAWHHLRGVHARVIRCTGTAPARLRFELGLRGDAPPLMIYGPGEVRVRY